MDYPATSYWLKEETPRTRLLCILVTSSLFQYPVTLMCKTSWSLNMMTSSNANIFPRCWSFVQGIHRSPVNSRHNGQWREALMFSLICVWKNGWVNNREAGDMNDMTGFVYNCQIAKWYDGLNYLSCSFKSTRFFYDKTSYQVLSGPSAFMIVFL